MKAYVSRPTGKTVMKDALDRALEVKRETKKKEKKS